HIPLMGTNSHRQWSGRVGFLLHKFHISMQKKEIRDLHPTGNGRTTGRGQAVVRRPGPLRHRSAIESKILLPVAAAPLTTSRKVPTSGSEVRSHASRYER